MVADSALQGGTAKQKGGKGASLDQTPHTHGRQTSHACEHAAAATCPLGRTRPAFMCGHTTGSAANERRLCVGYHGGVSQQSATHVGYRPVEQHAVDDAASIWGACRKLIVQVHGWPVQPPRNPQPTTHNPQPQPEAGCS